MFIHPLQIKHGVSRTKEFANDFFDSFLDKYYYF